MAKTRLSQATFVTRGYGQVEPNHLSAQRTGQIYAQLPANKSIEVLENGQFAKYDYATGEVNFTGKGEWMLVYNEVKVYDARETDEDFAMIKTNYDARVYSPVGQTGDKLTYGKEMPDGTKMVPRLLKTNIGDIFTTNTVKETSLDVNEELIVGDDGYLTKTPGTNAGDMKFLVVKVYTLADGQAAVKLQRIA